MITKNFKAIIAWLLQIKTYSPKGYTPIKDVNGNTLYSSGNISNYPAGKTSAVIINTTTNPGIYLGSGSTPPTENDYSLESRITGGLTPSSTNETAGVDENGNPFITFVFTLTNTTANDITVAEIGYFQTCMAAASYGGNASAYERFMLDRTVLQNPVTVPANGNAVIEYTLKTIIQ